jgi:hypothetical protein
MKYSLKEIARQFLRINALRTLICNTVKVSWTEVGDLLSKNAQNLDQGVVTHDWLSRKDPDDLELREGVTVVNDRVVFIVSINDIVVWNSWET